MNCPKIHFVVTLQKKALFLYSFSAWKGFMSLTLSKKYQPFGAKETSFRGKKKLEIELSTF